MNAVQLKKQIGAHLRLRPPARHFDRLGNEAPPRPDEKWALDAVEPLIRLRHVPTDGTVELGHDNVREYRSPDILFLRCEIVNHPRSGIRVEPFVGDRPDGRTLGQSPPAGAQVRVQLVQVGPTDFRFVFSNLGAAPATDIHFEIPEGSPDNPLVAGDVARKLPYPELHPGEHFALIAALHLTSALRYAGRLSWTNPDGSRVTRDVQVVL